MKNHQFPNALNAGRHRTIATARAFTLVELVTTLVIVSALAVIGAPLMAGGMLNYFAGLEITRQDAAGKLAMERMLRELRHIRAPNDISTFTTSTVTFVDVYGKTVTYTFSGGNITRQESGGTARTLASNVTSFTLGYLKNDGQTTASTKSDVFYITLQMTISVTANLRLVNASYVGSVRILNA